MNNYRFQEYFHDTRGGVVLPDVFKFEKDGYEITATHDFVFQLKHKS